MFTGREFTAVELLDLQRLWKVHKSDQPKILASIISILK